MTIDEDNFMKRFSCSENLRHERSNILHFVQRGDNDRDGQIRCRHVRRRSPLRVEITRLAGVEPPFNISRGRVSVLSLGNRHLRTRYCDLCAAGSPRSMARCFSILKLLAITLLSHTWTEFALTVPVR